MPNVICSSSRYGLHISYAIVLIVAAFILFDFEYPPLQDYSEWIYQAQAFNALLTHGHSEIFFIKTYPVPYALSQIVMSVMYIFFSPLATSKIIIFLYICFTLFSMRMFISKFALDENAAAPVLVSVFILNSCFWNGFIGYQIGLAIFVLYLCLPSDKKTSKLFILIFSLASFFSHGLIYVSFCLTSGVYCLYDRQIKSLAIGLFPSIILLAWYLLANQTSTLAYPVVLSGALQFALYKIYTFLKAGPYHNFIINGVGDAESVGAGFVFGVLVNVSFMFAVAVCLASAIWSDGVKQLLRSAEMITALILLVIVLALPARLIGIANPGERFLYPAVILASCALIKKGRTTSLSGISLSAIVTIGLAISMVSLAAPRLTRPTTTSAAAIARDSLPSEPERRELFGHRRQFDEKMREAQRSWRAGDMPTLPLAFDTGLVGNGNAGW